MLINDRNLADNSVTCITDFDVYPTNVTQILFDNALNSAVLIMQ
jgi:hypothetical protein